MPKNRSSEEFCQKIIFQEIIDFIGYFESMFFFVFFFLGFFVALFVLFFWVKLIEFLKLGFVIINVDLLVLFCHFFPHISCDFANGCNAQIRILRFNQISLFTSKSKISRQRSFKLLLIALFLLFAFMLFFMDRLFYKQIRYKFFCLF